ncbi:unnamed protein product [Didymodactylos carnosus]|uniref:DDE-1 domain-containing protein n=1 Tax=Didymodactylos carnosus TaxID=1234261 RepID=A0A816AKJ5_9BILA|nr:unnamed protein product [Didymodactylos carnosus]CAF4473802.1 unnamed protein product [Didymodactylos carnosus]
MSKRVAYNISERGCMEKNSFYEWFINLFIPQVTNTTPKPILLILEGHSFHHSVRTMKLATENDIVLLSLPPNSTRILQSLDVTLFKSIKQKDHEILNEYFRTSGHKDTSKKVLQTLINKLFKSTVVRKIETDITATTRDQPSNTIEIEKAKDKVLSRPLSPTQLLFAKKSSTLRMTTKADSNTHLRDRSAPSEFNGVINKIPNLNTSAWDHNDGLSDDRSEDVIPQINSSVLDHDYRETGQLLTTKQALEQITEIEERAKKQKSLREKLLVTSSTPKRSARKPKSKKKVSTVQDLLKDIDNPPACSSNSFTLSTIFTT